MLMQLLTALHARQIQSVLVEGGSKLLQSFIDARLWDEARVITNEVLSINNGLAAPVLKNELLIHEQKINTDVITFFKRQ
jgi:diaminohydroxyphosphoribosylaminopyrimidine deaminase/5-amino-6-(5-phosphoribosylamino)uracil reductase